jgi:hypothetical protein
MIYPLPGALSQLWEDAPVAVAGVLSYDVSYVGHQTGFLFALLGSIFPVVVGALRKLDRSEALI